jgi:IS5 family transposase
LSDLEIERQIADRISFMAFLGFPDPIPDSRTIWLFREPMAWTGKDKIVWAALQRQMDAMGLQVKRGTCAKKGNETHFGYKLHQKTDIDYGLIREIKTTTASLHDSEVDLSTKAEVVLRDRVILPCQQRISILP